MNPSGNVPNAKGPVIAALDLGSNSFHLVVVIARPDRSFHIVASEKRMLRLGEEVAYSGSISASSIQKAAKTVAELSKIAELAGAEETVAFATSAFRDASNSEDALDAITQVSGVHPHVISGVREAQLIYQAVRSHLSLEPFPALICDLGGGSLELIIGDQRQSYFTSSLPLGVGRLKANFSGSDPLTPKERASLVGHIHKVMEPAISRITDFDPRSIVVSSGTFGALLRVAKASRAPFGTDEQFDDEPVGVKEIQKIGKRLLALGTQKRITMAGMDPKRVDLLPIGWLVLSEILSATKVTTLRYSDWALREGIILDLLEAREDFEFAFDAHDLREGAVRALAEKFHGLNSHAIKVQEFSIRLAESLRERLKLDSSDIELLGYSAILHDIGEWIAQEDHDKHSAYLVETSPLKGFSDLEKSMISSIVRFHKRGTPKPADYQAFQKLRPLERSRVLILAGILRIADALDRSHASVIDSLSVEVTQGSLTILVDTKQDISMEINGFRKKKGLFEELTKMDAEIYLNS